MVIDTNDIYIIDSVSPILGRRREEFIIGKANADEFYELNESLKHEPIMYKAVVLNSGKITRGGVVR